ncbi:Stk1 family PASTA domain-containing Ser/Thr kinase [Paenibacillus contaminans]|uniref:Serine/threonine-protein kinase PrkC n=1 Tax=Paenibacillus contaminans TaxID=450362 RepID=A0A329MML6_9BACL|nr:Stk1 family PASTA domain-containing Ser/Thr kinase [Paenibacillus contaminans]RAV19953.1 Stk1 family PASTA domain-containing Ser/Thr kinase [Paenibacillus contaminans]
MIGQELGGRYELLDRVGGGGMAIVYKGHDLLLNRNVAVKVLRQQYVHDEEFIRRFRREAQSAASLSHPNVVSIYDVGQEEDIHYIVMEYIEGMTLNDLIKEKAPLQVEDAIHIATQICDALDHAHSNQIIHRDIKPHNILIGKNGRVKVTDFGIARAATSSTITQTGSVIGSVHYFSPEHAKGIAAGAKSDLYSLGIVLYQMLTGKLPFLGESPISVALKHLQENVEEPRKVNPLIPQSIENIILKAMRKNPDERYQSAKEMMSDLETCMLPERRNEPKLSFADADEWDEERTRVVPAIRSDSFPQDGDDDDDVPKRGKKKKSWVAPVVWTVILLVTIVGMWFGVKYVQDSMPKDVPIPNVEGKPLEEAQAELKAVNLNYRITEEFNKETEKGRVIRQSPSAMKIKEGSIINLTVSKGVEKQVMQSYIGKKWSAVKQELKSAGYTDIQLQTEEIFHKEEKDTIVAQTPNANDEFDPMKPQFKFTISKGLEKKKMPNLTGKTLNEAKGILTSMNLSLTPGAEGVVEQPSYDQPKGRVIAQHPYKPDEDVDDGAGDIVLFVSSGPPANAVTETFMLNKTFEPATAGKTSKFRIVVSDARKENSEYKTMDVSKNEAVSVQVTLTPDKNAVVQVYRDNTLYDTQTFTYQDYLKTKNPPSPSPTPKPSESVKPVDAPAQSPKSSPSSSPGGR